MYIDTINMGIPIMHFKGSLVEFTKLQCISVSEVYLNLTEPCRPNEMPHLAAFHLGLLCLPKYPFRDLQYTKG